MTMDELKPKQSAFIRSVGGTGALRHHLLVWDLHQKRRLRFKKFLTTASRFDIIYIEARYIEAK